MVGQQTKAWCGRQITGGKVVSNPCRGNRELAGRAEEGPGRLSTCVHGVIVTPRNLVIPTLFLSLRVEFLALDLIGAEVRKAHEGFGKLRLKFDK